MAKKLTLLLLLTVATNCFAAEWEGLRIHDGGFRFTERLYVPCGWLVRTETRNGVGLTFYPDKNHEWKV